MNVSPAKRIFLKGSQARRRYIEDEQKFRVTRFISLPGQTEILKQQPIPQRSKVWTSKQKYRTKKLNFSLTKNQKTEQESTTIKLNDLDKINHVQYRVMPIIT